MLSDVKINDLIQEETDKYINTIGYSVLRQHCLDQKPIPAVVDEIHTQLKKIVHEDKEIQAAFLVARASEMQIQQDLSQIQSDNQQMQNDLLQQAQLRNESVTIKSQINLSQSEIMKDQNEIIHLQSILKQIDLHISNHNHSHPAEHVHGHSKDHTHEHPAEHVHGNPKEHTHEHSKEHTHGHTTEHTHADSLQEKQKLEQQKQSIQMQLSALNNNLAHKQAAYRKLETRLDEINHELLEVLPQKAQQRGIHAQERGARETARLKNLGLEKELSANNYNSLSQAIINAHEKLDKQKSQLMTQVNATSYTVYLARLAISKLKLSYQEAEALKQIVKHMQDYLEIKTKEQNAESTLRNACSDKDKLVSELTNAEEYYRNLNNSNPQLAAKNIELAQENNELVKTIEETQQFRKKLLKSGLFSLILTSGSVGGAFLAIYFLTIIPSLMPLVFIPAVLAGATTLGLFIASLVYTVINNRNKAQLNDNLSTIERNNQKISSQNTEISTLEQVTLPNLKNQIAEAEKNISVIKNNIAGLKAQAELLLDKANKVSVIAANDPDAFFTPPPAYSPTEDKPSAPSLEKTDPELNEERTLQL